MITRRHLRDSAPRTDGATRWTACVAVLTLVLAASPAAAGQFSGGSYQCTVDVVAGTHDCWEGIVNVTYQSGVQRVVEVDLSPSYVRLDALVESCDPTGWWFHLADSPTANGGGGDGGTTDHDAEAHVVGGDVEHHGNFDYLRGVVEPRLFAPGALPTVGCATSQWTVFEDRFLLDDDPDPGDAPRIETRTIFGFERSPYDEQDNEDPSEIDGLLWYAGINRTVGASWRSGTGTDRVCFVVSDTTSPSPSLLFDLCYGTFDGGGDCIDGICPE